MEVNEDLIGDDITLIKAKVRLIPSSPRLHVHIQCIYVRGGGGVRHHTLVCTHVYVHVHNYTYMYLTPSYIVLHGCLELYIDLFDDKLFICSCTPSIDDLK